METSSYFNKNEVNVSLEAFIGLFLIEDPTPVEKSLEVLNFQKDKIIKLFYFISNREKFTKQENDN